jgi:hypothetical protein
LDRETASLDASTATIVIHAIILGGNSFTNENRGVRTNVPINTSWTDMRDAAWTMRRDWDLRFKTWRRPAVTSIVEMDDASCAGLSVEDVDNVVSGRRTEEDHDDFNIGIDDADGRVGIVRSGRFLSAATPASERDSDDEGE